MTEKKKNNTSQVSSPHTQTLPPLTDGLEFDIVEVAKLMGYRFKNVKHLREALTHPSFTNSPYSSSTESASFERLEFLGDAALNQVFTKDLFCSHPFDDPGSLTELRKAIVCRDNMARVAVRHNLYIYLRRYNVSDLNEEVRKYTESSRKDAPKVLADIVESIAGAVYVDSGFDLDLLWKVFRGLFKPIEEKHKKKEAIHTINTYMGGTHCGTGFSEDKEMAKLTASPASLKKCTDQGLDLAMASSEKLRVNLSVPRAKRQASPMDCCQVVQKEEESKQNLNASMNSSQKSRVSLSEPDAKRHESPAKCCQVEKEDESKKKLNGCSWWMRFFFSCFIIYLFLFSMADNVD